MTGNIPTIARLLQFGQRCAQDFSRRKNDGSLDKILQLPHVARPRVSEQNLHRPVRNALNIFLHAPGAKIHKVAHEQRDVFGAFPQRREAHREHVQAIIEITSELTVRHHLRQIATRGRHHANVHARGVCAAKPLKFLFLEHT